MTDFAWNCLGVAAVIAAVAFAVLALTGAAFFVALARNAPADRETAKALLDMRPPIIPVGGSIRRVDTLPPLPRGGSSTRSSGGGQ